MRFRFAAIGLAVVAASTFAGAQQRPVFRSEANYVEVDAVVTDEQGHFVTGLTPADFVVRENYKRQPLDIVEYVNLSSPAGPVSETRVRSSLGLQPDDVKGRIYLLYFNLADTQSLTEVGAQAQVFINDFVQPGDLVGLWSSDAMSQTLTFTSDKQELLDSLPPTGHVASGAAIHKGAQLGKLDDAMAFLSGIQGRRKALILFSPGWSPSNFGQWGTNAAASVPWSGVPAMSGAPAVVGGRPQYSPFWNSPSDLTGRADVQIYTVDSRGLAAPGLWARTHQQLAAGLDMNTWSTDMLRSIADETGGLAIFNTNDYRDGFARIVEDNSRYYVLGYSSAVKDRRNRFIPVEVKSVRPGLTVRARKGYFAR